jgi:hypothetical protein
MHVPPSAAASQRSSCVVSASSRATRIRSLSRSRSGIGRGAVSEHGSRPPHSRKNPPKPMLFRWRKLLHPTHRARERMDWKASRKSGPAPVIWTSGRSPTIAPISSRSTRFLADCSDRAASAAGSRARVAPRPSKTTLSNTSGRSAQKGRLCAVHASASRRKREVLCSRRTLALASAARALALGLV